ncbi:hypothetical protein JOD57_002751 [Geodermatophilus bullaregiensis]|nr:hypothetical protein [Geodermatophilus bullaregiensis]
MRLQRDVAGQAQPLGGLQRLGEPGRGVVRRRDVQHLARPHELVEGGERLLQRRRLVVVVRVVEVDAVGPQVAQRALGGLADLPGGEGVRLLLRRGLGGHEHPVAQAPVGHPPAEDLLGAAVPVHLGGVDEGAQGAGHGVGEAVEDRVGRRLVGGPAEDVATQAEVADGQVGPGELRHATHAR